LAIAIIVASLRVSSQQRDALRDAGATRCSSARGEQHDDAPERAGMDPHAERERDGKDDEAL
jgi:hypothetical protein